MAGVSLGSGVSSRGVSSGSVGSAGVAESAFTGPLDGLGVTPVGAWSVARRLTVDYTGPLIRIRESGGDTELDIGFDADGNLDTAAAAAHIGANSGFITTIYDQIGSGDLTQATAANQPAYLASGINSLPTADHDGSNHFTQANGVAASFSGDDLPLTALVVAEADDITAVRHLFTFRNSTTVNRAFVFRNSDAGEWAATRRGDADGSFVSVTGAGADLDPHVQTWWFTGTALSMEEDTTLIIDAEALDTGSMTVNTFNLGATKADGVPTNFWDGKISEIVLFDESLADTPRDALRDEMISHYGTG